MLHEYTKQELKSFETIEQSWDGDELKIETDIHRVWLAHPENRLWNGDYTVETLVNGKWEQSYRFFN